MKLTTAIARMIPCATLLVCLLMPVLASADERKENMLIEYVRLDEDATSSFYYFFYSPLHGDYIEKVRIYGMVVQAVGHSSPIIYLSPVKSAWLRCRQIKPI